MNDASHSFTVAMPLDRDGFLRRECPTCEREFKWFVSDEDEAEQVPDGGYFCPYCAIQAPISDWLTKAQAETASAIGAREILGPFAEQMGRNFERINKPGGMIQVSVKTTIPDEPEPLTEDDDMRRVDFECHPNEPIKVLDEWDRPAHCLICGESGKHAS